MCLGLIKGLDNDPMINDGFYLAPGLAELINSLISSLCTHRWLSFRWTSLQVNYNIVAEWHQDGNNIGTSAMLVGADFSSGEFEIEGAKPLQLRGSLVFFRGQDWHCSHPFQGCRVSIVAFTHSFSPDCKQQTLDRLQELGFCAPPVMQ